MSSNLFAPFGDDAANEATFNFNINVNNFERTFESLITERGNEITQTFNQNYVNYNTLFENIKNKLFFLNYDITIDINEYPDIKKWNEEFLELKKSVCDNYINFMKAETLFNNAKEKYNMFCENIKKCINSIDICGLNNESDTLLKEIIENKIEEYFINLNLEQLKKEYTQTQLIFEKTKHKINTITGVIIPTTICQICLEHQVEFFIDPCGHALCKNCKDKCEKVSSTCHYCRTKKNGYKRLYL